MNPFYLVIVQNKSIPAIYKYDTFDGALVAYHNELAYRNEARTSTQCVILDGDMHIIMRETYDTSAPESQNITE